STGRHVPEAVPLEGSGSVRMRFGGVDLADFPDQAGVIDAAETPPPPGTRSRGGEPDLPRRPAGPECRSTQHRAALVLEIAPDVDAGIGVGVGLRPDEPELDLLPHPRVGSADLSHRPSPRESPTPGSAGHHRPGETRRRTGECLRSRCGPPNPVPAG